MLQAGALQVIPPRFFPSVGLGPHCAPQGCAGRCWAVQAAHTHILPQDVLHAIQRTHATALIAVPAMITDMHSAATHPLPALQRILVGGGSPSVEQLAVLRWLFPRARVSTAYGMSEASSSITFDHIDHHVEGQPNDGCATTTPACGQDQGSAQHTDSAVVGCPPEGVRVRLLPSGEIVTAGPHVMLRYWGDAAATRRAIDADGWLHTGRHPLRGVVGCCWVHTPPCVMYIRSQSMKRPAASQHTGDLGCFNPQGQLCFTGRVKDVIKSGGENVHAGSVERALESHPSVVEAAVVGTPHPRLGEAVSAWVVVGDRTKMEGLPEQHAEKPVYAEALQAHCRTVGLPGYALPRRVLVTCERLPRTSMGKVVGGVVKQLVMEQGVQVGASTRARL